MLYKKVALIVVIVLLPLLFMSCQSTINKSNYNVIVFDHNASSKSNWDAKQVINSTEQSTQPRQEEPVVFEATPVQNPNIQQ